MPQSNLLGIGLLRKYIFIYVNLHGRSRIIVGTCMANEAFQLSYQFMCPDNAVEAVAESGPWMHPCKHSNNTILRIEIELPLNCSCKFNEAFCAIGIWSILCPDEASGLGRYKQTTP